MLGRRQRGAGGRANGCVTGGRGEGVRTREVHVVGLMKGGGLGRFTSARKGAMVVGG